MPDEETTREKIRRLEAGKQVEVKPTINVNVNVSGDQVKEIVKEVPNTIESKGILETIGSFLDKFYK